MGKVKLVLVLVLAVLTLLFVFQNTQSFEVRFLFFRFAFPGAALLFAVFVVGFAVGAIVGSGHASRRSRK